MWHVLRRKVGWAAGQTAKCNIRKGESRSTTGEKKGIKKEKGKDLSSRNRFEVTNSYRKEGRKEERKKEKGKDLSSRNRFEVTNSYRKKGRKKERKKKEKICRHGTGLK